MTIPSEPGAPLPLPCPRPWLGSSRQYAVLLGGALLIAGGVALTITAELGVGSWQVFETGLMAVTDVSFAVVAVVESIVVLVLAWAWLGQRPGPATILFALAVGPLVSLLLGLLGPSGVLLWSVARLVVGMGLLGLGVGFYVGAGLGASAQDSLFVGLFRRYSMRPRDARILTDVALVAFGWLLGGQVGVGTVAITVGLPLVVEPGMRLGGRLAGIPAAVVSPQAIRSRA